MIQRAVGFAARLSFKHKEQVLQGPPLLEMPVLLLGASEQARLALPLFLIRQKCWFQCVPDSPRSPLSGMAGFGAHFHALPKLSWDLSEDFCGAEKRESTKSARC